VESGSGDLYAGHDGNVYRKTEDGWQQHGDGGWTDVDVPDRPERSASGDRPDLGEGGGNFSRDEFNSASRDAASDAAGSRISNVGEPRYGGSGSLESRGAGDNYGSRTSGTRGTQPRASSSNYSQLNRDASARSGGYQNYQRRSTGGMSRGMRPRRRSKGIPSGVFP
jgi:hypothetical protein